MGGLPLSRRDQVLHYDFGGGHQWSRSVGTEPRPTRPTGQAEMLGGGPAVRTQLKQWPPTALAWHRLNLFVDRTSSCLPLLDRQMVPLSAISCAAMERASWTTRIRIPWSAPEPEGSRHPHDTERSATPGLRRRGVDHVPDFGERWAGNPPCLVLAHHLFVGREVDAVDLVVGDVAVDTGFSGRAQRRTISARWTGDPPR